MSRSALIFAAFVTLPGCADVEPDLRRGEEALSAPGPFRHQRAHSGGGPGLESPFRQSAWSPGLRAETTPDGTVRVRSTGGPELEIRTAAWGRGTVLLAVEARAQTVDCIGSAAPGCVERLERADAGLREWWRPADGGVELGWDLRVRPPGDGPVRLAVEVRGPTGPSPVRLSPRGGLRFDDARGGALDVRPPRAWDSSGNTVAASFAPTARGFDVTVDDAGATWPITVDPLITVAGWTWTDGVPGTVSATGVDDVNGDGFEDLLVGHSFWPNTTYDGALYLFYGSASWFGSTPDWSYFSPVVGAELGGDVDAVGDIDGDGYADFVAGAAQQGAGTVHVFRGGASGPGGAPWWSASGPPGSSLFAYAVAGIGDTDADGFADVAAGSYAYTNGQNLEGIVSVWRGGATMVGPVLTVEGSDLGVSWLGESIAGAGDTNGDGYADIVVGTHIGSGAAFVFAGGPSGPAATPIWTGNGPELSNYGQAAATMGDADGDGYSEFAIGAPLAEATDLGQTTVYFGGPTGPGAGGAWTLAGTAANGGLGATVAPVGDADGDGRGDLAIGALSDGGLLFGSAQPLGPSQSLNQGSSFAWPHGAVDASADGFADVLIVESSVVSTLPVTPATSLVEDPLWPWATGQAGAEGGAALTVIADVDGDGASEIAAGSPGWDGAAADAGRVAIFVDPAQNPAPTPTATVDGLQASADFASALDGRGDCNGDGYADLLVGAPQHNDGQPQEGAAWLYLGGPSGLSTTAAWTTTSDQGGARLGSSARFVGDVNGDGFDDAALGLLQWDGGQLNEGALWLFYGTSSGLSTTPAWTAEPDQSQALAVGGPAGDVDGDGFADLLWNARGYDDGGTDNGRVAVFLGSAGGPASTPQWTQSGAPGAWFGSAAEPAGDVDGDGFGDLLVGASHWSNGETLEGAAFLFTGGPSGLSPVAAATAEGAQAGALFGSSLAGLGDVDLDGLADLAVGAPGWDDGAAADAGSLFLFLSSEGGLRGGAVPQWSGASAGEALGTSIAGGWDNNGDGRVEIAAGAPGFAAVGADEGAVRRWILDAPTNPWPARFRATRPGTDTPIAPGLRSGGDGAFDVRAFVHSPWGRTRASIDVEVVPLGSPFTGAPTHRGAGAVDTGLAGVEFVTEVTGLSPGPYRWRARLRWDMSQRPPTPWGPWVLGGAGRGGAHVVAEVFGPSPDDSDGDGDNDASDCAPLDPWIGPSATEVSGDGLDSDCDALELCYDDGDQDGFRVESTTSSGLLSCPTALGLASAGAPLDCNDNAALAYAGAPELNGTGVDEDCDGVEWCWEDLDSDGAHAGAPTLSDDLDCDDIGEAWDTAATGDCDDFDASFGPAALDPCGDGLDQDCDGADATCGDDDDSAAGDDDSAAGDDDSAAGDDDSAPSGDDDTVNPGDDDTAPDDDTTPDDDDSGLADDDSAPGDDDSVGDDDTIGDDDSAPPDDDSGDDDSAPPDDDGGDDDSAPPDDDSGDDDGGPPDDDAAGDDDSADDDTVLGDDDAVDPPATTTLWTGGPGCVVACEGRGSGAALVALFAVTRARRKRHGRTARGADPRVAPVALLTVALVSFAGLPLGVAADASTTAPPAPADTRPPRPSPPDFAEILSTAQHLHGEWCAVADRPEPDRAYDAQAAIWPTLEAIHTALSGGAPTYLRYWRALLGACINREDQAIADLEAFLAVDGDNPSFVTMVKDARARLTRLRRSRGGSAAPDFRSLPRFGVRLGGGWARWASWDYLDLSAGAELRLHGPLHLQAALRLSIGEPLEQVAGDPASAVLVPVLGSGAFGLVVRVPAPVVPEFGLSVVVGGNPSPNLDGHVVVDRGSPVLVGPAGSAGLSVPVGRVALFVAAEGAYLHPHPGLHLVAGLRL